MVRTILLSLIILTSGCAILKEVKPRLPSPHKTEKGIVFLFYAPSAQYVNVCGDFNRWCGTQDGPFNPDIGRMYDNGKNGDKKAKDGIWTIIIPLQKGRYQYKFVVNGTTWYLDPSNTETVLSGGFQNSLLRVE